jgi:HD superfamily phosphohydrolase
MYRSVYFHKTTRAAEVMLKMIFQRLRDLIHDFGGEFTPGLTPRQKQRRLSKVLDRLGKIAPGIPPVVVSAFCGSIALRDYLLLDDFSINDFFKACANSSDPHLWELGYGLLHRRLFKGLDLTDMGPNVARFNLEAVNYLNSKKANPGYEFGEDTPADTPYKPYDPDVEKPAAQIYVESGAGKIVEISTVSDPVATLRKKYQLVRYYFPERYRDAIMKIAAPLMRK